MSIDDLMSQIPIADLAAQLGVSDAEAEQAVRAALPALVGGMQANAQDPAGAASLQRSVAEHDGSLLDGGVDLAQVDTDDGAKIVKKVFGDNEDAVVNQLGGLGGGLSGGLIAKLLPMLVPLLMSFLGKSFGGGGSSNLAPSSGSSDTSGMGPGSGGMGPATSTADESGGSGGGRGGNR